MDRSILSSVSKMKTLDRSGMLQHLYGFPEQMEEAWKLAGEASLQTEGKVFDHVVVTGLGGSAIGGDLLRTLLADEIRVPILVNRNYMLPEFVSERTLVIASSYSGNTEETLAAYDDATNRDATVVAVTTGGKLAEKAKGNGHDVIYVPSGLPPRAATGYMFIPTVALLERFGLIESKSEEVKNTVALMKELREQYRLEEDDNLAKELALWLHERMAIIYGAGDIGQTLAFRWQSQINENAKVLAHGHTFPELNHNELMGWELVGKDLNLGVVFLRGVGEIDRISKRMDITGELIGQMVEVREIEASGSDTWQKTFSLMYLGDYLSCYLALLNGVDPTSIDSINYLKDQLAQF